MNITRPVAAVLITLLFLVILSLEGEVALDRETIFVVFLICTTTFFWLEVGLNLIDSIFGYIGPRLWEWINRRLSL